MQQRWFSLPEVGQEALQVVGVAQLVLPLVGATHQAAPGRIQLRALLLDVVHRLGVGLDQTLRRLPQRVYLRSGQGEGGGRILQKRLGSITCYYCNPAFGF